MSERSNKSRPADFLEHEFVQERASALSRQGRALERALAALFERDIQGSSESPAQESARRAALIERASTALWHFIVQREACGLRDMPSVLRDYRVPAEVAARMGAAPGSPRAGSHPKAAGGNMLTNHPLDGHEQ